MSSLRSRLWLLWLLSAIASVAVGLMLLELYETSATAQTERAAAVAARDCDRIAAAYGFYATGWNGSGGAPPPRDLAAVVASALAGRSGVVGGIYPDDGSDAAMLPALRAVNREAATGEQSVLRHVQADGRTRLLAACPLGGPISGLTAWTMIRVTRAEGTLWLRAGVALLLTLVVGIAGWVAWLTAAWARHIRTIEAVLATHAIEDLPKLPRTGERELDRIVSALNDAGQRLSQARARAAEMAVRVAAAERLAALGRVAAGIAHEIRNPMAAMRLRAENALAGDATRHQPALHASLAQIGAVERLVTELLAMTQRREPEQRAVEPGAFLEARAAMQRQTADAAGITLGVDAEATTACFDPELIGRAVDNLLMNALRHTPRGGRVALRATTDASGLRITVTDSGPGVDPALLGRLFEPFVTGRPDGTGLGLAIAREMVEAHGGRLLLGEAGPGMGASFVLELPWAPA